MLKMAANKLQQGQRTPTPSSLPMDNNAQKPRLLEHQSDSHGVHNSFNVNAIHQESDQTFLMQGLGKQREQHMPFPQSSFSNYENNGGNYSSPNMNMSPQSSKKQTHDLQIRQGPIQNGHFTNSSGLQQSSGHWQPSTNKDQCLISSMAYAKQEPLDQMNDQQHKSQLSVANGPSLISPESIKEETFEIMSSRPSFSTSLNQQEPMSITTQLEHPNVIRSASLASGSNAKSTPEKPTVGQKKPLEAPVSSLSKKQNVCGSFLDQSLDHLNDVTAVSGVNLRAFDDEDYVVDDDKDGHVELPDPKLEQCELVENVSPMSDSMENFSSPQSSMICVQGYKVKHSDATILQAIFKKHGDIAANCTFKTSSTRTHFLEVVGEGSDGFKPMIWLR